jgi:23S rRNA (adenine2030-N6)-methyltransferase
MNYRHDYHAGNFADVLKHIVLARVIAYMKRKPRAFRVVDTHAGAGLYDLSGTEAGKTGEWRDGIGRLSDADLSEPAAELLAPYLDAVRAVNAPGELKLYPGSVLIARQLMRTEDVLVANELNAAEFKRLKDAMRGYKAATLLNIDAWHAVKSLLPPKERRGVVLIDPPFEEADEFANLTHGVAEATRRFATGTYLIWYPLKDTAAADAFIEQTAIRPRAEYLNVRLAVCAPFPGLGLTACGVLVLNPPYGLEQELETALAVVSELLSEGEGSAFWMTGSAARGQ